MSVLESLLLSYLLNSLWQVPLLMAAAWLGAFMVRPAGPVVEHRVWVGALVCQSLLPGLSLLPWERLRIAWPWHAHATAIADGHVSVEMGAGAGFAAWWLSPMIAAGLVIAYVATTTYFASRFGWHLVRLRRLICSARPVVLRSEVAESRRVWMAQFDGGGVEFKESDEVFAPMTVGLKKKQVLLPLGFMHQVAKRELDAAIAHEFAHIKRNDFAKNLVYEVVSLAVSFHPASWLTRQRVAETREMVCDEMASGIVDNGEYPRSLLRLAELLLQGRPVRIPQALGVFDANTLERRLMRLTVKKRLVGRMRRYISMGACVALGVAAAGSALALRMGVESPAGNNLAAQQEAPRSVPPRVMASQLVKKVTPAYPVAAKKARIQGSIVLDALIGKAGTVEDLKVESGPKELQQSALDAVKQWEYKPFLLNGDPIEVKTTISVVYTLAK